MALSLFRLQQYYLSEIVRGLSGHGNYQLHSGLSPKPSPSKYADVNRLETIVDEVRYGIPVMSEPTTSHTLLSADDQAVAATAHGPTSDTDDITTTKTPSSTPASVMERALYIIKTGAISLDMKM